MASIIKRGKSWEVYISKKGIRKTATFSTKIEAQNWAAATEAGIIAEKVSGIPDKTCGDLL
ncbi:MAG: site-specific integrase, partial [Candidatus Nitrotoga sp.]